MSPCGDFSLFFFNFNVHKVHSFIGWFLCHGPMKDNYKATFMFSIEKNKTKQSCKQEKK